MNYVIGHGLYIKSNDIKRIGYYTINEDAFLGVILNYSKIINKESNNEYKRDLLIKGVKDKVNLFLICFKLYLHAIYWISAVYILFVLYTLVNYKLFGIYGILYSFAINYMNIVLFNYLSYKSLNKYVNFELKFSLLQFPLLFYFIHSFGPILNVIKTFLGKNTINNKYKIQR